MRLRCFAKGFLFQLNQHDQYSREHEKYGQVLSTLEYCFIFLLFNEPIILTTNEDHFLQNKTEVHKKIPNRARTQEPTQLQFSRPQLPSRGEEEAWKPESFTSPTF